ncbi:MAG: lipopolysaccharide heptosyltransferase II [Nitrospirae bacterium]|nr:lipopolysaccharide heptosyltransferase II [Nitrospirota bacterium]
MFKIIVRVPNWIGDAVLSTPALHLLGQKFPDSRIVVLAKEWVAPVFEANPDVREIYVMKEGESRRGLAGRLKAAKFDLGVLFPNSFSSAFLFRLAGIPRRVGYATDGRSFLLTQRIKRPSRFREEHQVDYYKKLVEAIIGNGQDDRQMLFAGFLDNEKDKRLVWVITKDEEKRAKKLLRKAKVPPDAKLIGLSPGAAFGPAKRWFPDRFAKLGEELQKRYQAKIILFGSSGEKEITDSIEARMDSPGLNLAGQTTLRELGALISRCFLFITNDTGTMHLAAAVKTPLVAIFGSTDPVRTCPLGEKSIVLRKATPCSPCLKKECKRKDYLCMDKITVEDVLRGCQKILNPRETGNR